CATERDERYAFLVPSPRFRLAPLGYLRLFARRPGLPPRGILGANGSLAEWCLRSRDSEIGRLSCGNALATMSPARSGVSLPQFVNERARPRTPPLVRPPSSRPRTRGISRAPLRTSCPRCKGPAPWT